MIKEPLGLREDTVLSMHERQLAEHGGLPGIRDEGLLKSALARPQNVHHDDADDIYALAAAYAFGIARNHPFWDGNKRTAFVAIETFLLLNGGMLLAHDVQATKTMLGLAAGEISEDDFAVWLRQNCRKQ